MRMIKITDSDSYKILNAVPESKWSKGLKKESQKVWDVMMRNPSMAGLAANQVDTMIRVMAVKGYGMILNPYLSSSKDDLQRWEGCYSIPGVHALVERPSAIVVKGQDVETGDDIAWPLDSRLSWVALHELDHLDGILMTSKAIDTKPAGYQIEMIP